MNKKRIVNIVLDIGKTNAKIFPFVTQSHNFSVDLHSVSFLLYTNCYHTYVIYLPSDFCYFFLLFCQVILVISVSLIAIFKGSLSHWFSLIVIISLYY